MEAKGILLWGAADLTGCPMPEDETGRGFPRALSWAVMMNPQIMAGIKNGINQAYADEYARVNTLINNQAEGLTHENRARGHRAMPLAASDRTDKVNIKGDFPHKTAATLAGLGWIGRNCQLVTRKMGPWVRLGTVFTDMDLPCGPKIERSYCGQCTSCIEACPAGALTGEDWQPGRSREEILDVHTCDQWKKGHYFQFHKGHNCGICSAVCPIGKKIINYKL